VKQKRRKDEETVTTERIREESECISGELQKERETDKRQEKVK
jgi:hypothetical protein